MHTKRKKIDKQQVNKTFFHLFEQPLIVKYDAL